MSAFTTADTIEVSSRTAETIRTLFARQITGLGKQERRIISQAAPLGTQIPGEIAMLALRELKQSAGLSEEEATAEAELQDKLSIYRSPDHSPAAPSQRHAEQ